MRKLVLLSFFALMPALANAVSGGNCWILGEGLSSSRAERAVRECWERLAQEAQQDAIDRANAAADYNEVARKAQQDQTNARVSALLASYSWGGKFRYNGFDGKSYYYSSPNLVCSIVMTSTGDSINCLNRADGSAAVSK